MPYETAWLRPSLPSRMPFRSGRITAYRQFALNGYLREVIRLSQPIPAARRTLLSFLRRSHMHWLYADDLAAPLAAPGILSLEDRAAIARHLADTGTPILFNRPNGAEPAQDGSAATTGAGAAPGIHRHAGTKAYNERWMSGTGPGFGGVHDVSSGQTAASVVVNGRDGPLASLSSIASRN